MTNIATKELFDKIEEFIKEQKKAEHGELAEVSDDELMNLSDIIRMLVDLKYEADMDGDYAIEWTLDNVTKNMGNPFVGVRKIDAYASFHDLMESMDQAATNVRISNSILERVQHKVRTKVLSLVDENDANKKELHSITRENHELHKALSFAASCIKGGEAWSESCDELIGGALSRDT